MTNDARNDVTRAEFGVRTVDGVLYLSGEFDLTGTALFDEAASRLLPADRLIVDLTELEFMDSSGLRSLMNLDLRIRAERARLTLRGPQPQVLRLLRMCGFDERLEIVDR